MTTIAASAPTAPSTPPAGPEIRDPRLEPLRAKVLAGQRLSLADGDLLYTTPDLWTVMALANIVRRRLHGDVAYYNINRHFNYSNVCALSCKFCEFYRKKGEPGEYTFSIEDGANEVRNAIKNGATEIHMVGGLQPYLPWSYYPDMIRAMKSAAAETGTDIHIKAFTAVEIVHLAKIAKKYSKADRTAGVRWVLQELKDAGLGSLPGGGAEVFDDRVHDQTHKTKIRSDEWLDVHLIAHELGLNTNATILYGHIDQRRERLVHMEILRRSQDAALARLGYEGVPPTTPEGSAPVEPGLVATEGIGAPVITLTREGVELPTVGTGTERHGPSLTLGAPSDPLRLASLGTSPVGDGGGSGTRGGYYQTIIPLPFFPDGSELEHLPGPSGLENYRTIAVARLMLDNFPHVKAFWIMQTLSMAQLMLEAGADDIDGTVVWYDITKVGGSGTHQETTVHDLIRAIREAGFEPVERDTLYRRVVREGTSWRVKG